MSALSFQKLLLPTLSALDNELEVAVPDALARIVATIELTIKRIATVESSWKREAFADGIGRFEIVHPILVPTFKERIAFVNAVGTVLAHLRHAGLVERLGRGDYRLTTEGRKLLSQRPGRIDLNLLRKIPRYADWPGYAKGKLPKEEEALGKSGGSTNAFMEESDVIVWTAAVGEFLPVDASLQFSIKYDPELGMLPAFAEALREYARCGTCGKSPQVYFSVCLCGDDSLIYVVDSKVWKGILEPLWKRDRRRAYSRNSGEWRREMIRDSDEPSYTPADIELLRSVRNDACYYCGASISESFQVDHLEPLSQGGSNGVANIMLARSACNKAKWVHGESKFWRKLRKRLSESEFKHVRESAKAIKRKKRIRLRKRQLLS